MPKAKATKKGARSKKMSQGKKLDDVKPLAHQYYIAVKGSKQGQF